jgi:hypothetical protein
MYCRSAAKMSLTFGVGGDELEEDDLSLTRE